MTVTALPPLSAVGDESVAGPCSAVTYTQSGAVKSATGALEPAAAVGSSQWRFQSVVVMARPFTLLVALFDAEARLARAGAGSEPAWLLHRMRLGRVPPGFAVVGLGRVPSRCGTASMAFLGRYTVLFTPGDDGVAAVEPVAISCLRSPTMMSTALLATVPTWTAEVLALDNCRVTIVREKYASASPVIKTTKQSTSTRAAPRSTRGEWEGGKVFMIYFRAGRRSGRNTACRPGSPQTQTAAGRCCSRLTSTAARCPRDS